MVSAHKILVEWTGLAGSPYLSTFWISTDNHPTPAAAANAVLSNLSTLASDLADAMSFNYVPEVTTYATPSQPTGTTIIAPGPVQNCSAPADPLPRSSQGLIKWDTGFYIGARRVQGKTFIPGYTVGVNDATGRPDTAALSSMQAVVNAFLGDGPQVASRKADQFIPIVAGAPWSEWAVLRSRRD